jgi:predicted peroxiredoxin
MTQEKANKIFETELGQQLNEIFVTSDGTTFVRRGEAESYCHDILEEGDDATKYNITVWYSEY